MDPFKSDGASITAAHTKPFLVWQGGGQRCFVSAFAEQHAVDLALAEGHIEAGVETDVIELPVAGALVGVLWKG